MEYELEGVLDELEMDMDGKTVHTYHDYLSYSVSADPVDQDEGGAAPPPPPPPPPPPLPVAPIHPPAAAMSPPPPPLRARSPVAGLGGGGRGGRSGRRGRGGRGGSGGRWRKKKTGDLVKDLIVRYATNLLYQYYILFLFSDQNCKVTIKFK